MSSTIPKFTATIATGLLAGAFLYGCLNVVPTFAEVPLEVHLVFRVQLMTHNSAVMQLLMCVSFLAPIWYAVTLSHCKTAKTIILMASAFALTSFLVTRFGNVPINQQLKTWSALHPPANWESLLHRWNTYNAIRTLTAIACFISMITGVHLAPDNSTAES